MTTSISPHAHAASFHVSYVREARALVLEGELDLATIGRLSQPLATALEATGPLMIDLSRLDFMDSSGIHALLDAARSLADRGWCLYLHTDGGAVERLLKLVKANTVPNIHVVEHPGFASHADHAGTSETVPPTGE